MDKQALQSAISEVLADVLKSDGFAGVIDKQVNKALKSAVEDDSQEAEFTTNLFTRREKTVEKQHAPGTGAARCIRALAAGKGDPGRASNFAKKTWDDRLGGSVSKALDAGDFTGGGFLLPEDMAQEVIQLLRPRSIVRRAGAPVIPMPAGTLTLPKQTGDISASYIGESKDITRSTPTGGQIVMSAKKLAALVPVSNDLLRYSGAPGAAEAADTYIRNTMVRYIATREDQAFLRDDGTQYTPKGLRYQAAAANITASAGTTATQVEQDFRELVNALEVSNVSMTSPVFLMSPRSKNYLLTLRDANGNLIYPEIRSASPTIHTFPVLVSTNIPTNLSGTNSEIYLINAEDLLIGEVGTLELAVDDTASYIEGASLVSAFSRDQTVIRAILRHDFAVVYPEAVAIKTGVAY